jgi:hypothetical protein
MNLDLHPQLKTMLAEYADAVSNHKPMASIHEGYAVILEELDELWDEIKASGPGRPNKKRIRQEAVQVAAMAYRFLVDCCEFGNNHNILNADFRQYEKPNPER